MKLVHVTLFPEEQCVNGNPGEPTSNGWGNARIRVGDVPELRG